MCVCVCVCVCVYAHACVCMHVGVGVGVSMCMRVCVVMLASCEYTCIGLQTGYTSPFAHVRIVQMLPSLPSSRYGPPSSTPGNVTDGPVATYPSKPREAWVTAPPIRGRADDSVSHEGGERGGPFGEERLRVGGEEMNPLLRPYDTTVNSKSGLMCVCSCTCTCMCVSVSECV